MWPPRVLIVFVAVLVLDLPLSRQCKSGEESGIDYEDEDDDEDDFT